MRSTRLYQMGEYTPLPQSDNFLFSKASRVITTPNGVFSVSPDYTVDFNASNFSSGIYFYSLKAGIL